MWEGAEICFYMNGTSHAIGLSDLQFAIITKILGLEYNNKKNEISFYSDETLKNLTEMQGNPLRLKKND